MYNLIRSILFLLPAETAHEFTTTSLKILCRIPGIKTLLSGLYTVRNKKLKRDLLGLHFPNPVGLAAGFDKNAEFMHEFKHLGFGFVEIGTLTPKPQPGNPKPRLFRLITDEAIINRMGFNNQGVEQAIEKLKKRPKNLIVGGNIGKNKVTSNEKAVEDYLYCFEALFPYVDYFVVNVSSPNTPDLRALQDKKPLTHLLETLKGANEAKPKTKPILLKIAPDLTVDQLDDILEILEKLNLDGIIATNTTIERAKLSENQATVEKIGAGGLSGRPLNDKSTEVIRYIRKKNSTLPIIGVGGIVDEKSALEKLDAGADLLQLYTGFVYKGPGLIRRINQAILKKS